jgi:TP901 family phage tail tape measure protein
MDDFTKGIFNKLGAAAGGKGTSAGFNFLKELQVGLLAVGKEAPEVAKLTYSLDEMKKRFTGNADEMRRFNDVIKNMQVPKELLTGSGPVNNLAKDIVKEQGLIFNGMKGNLSGASSEISNFRQNLVGMGKLNTFESLDEFTKKVYNTMGKLKGVTGKAIFGEFQDTGLLKGLEVEKINASLVSFQKIKEVIGGSAKDVARLNAALVTVEVTQKDIQNGAIGTSKGFLDWKKSLETIVAGGGKGISGFAQRLVSLGVQMKSIGDFKSIAGIGEILANAFGGNAEVTATRYKKVLAEVVAEVGSIKEATLKINSDKFGFIQRVLGSPQEVNKTMSAFIEGVQGSSTGMSKEAANSAKEWQSSLSRSATATKGSTQEAAKQFVEVGIALKEIPMNDFVMKMMKGFMAAEGKAVDSAETIKAELKSLYASLVVKGHDVGFLKDIAGDSTKFIGALKAVKEQFGKMFGGRDPGSFVKSAIMQQEGSLPSSKNMGLLTKQGKDVLLSFVPMMNAMRDADKGGAFSGLSALDELIVRVARDLGVFSEKTEFVQEQMKKPMRLISALTNLQDFALRNEKYGPAVEKVKVAYADLLATATPAMYSLKTNQGQLSENTREWSQSVLGYIRNFSQLQTSAKTFYEYAQKSQGLLAMDAKTADESLKPLIRDMNMLPVAMKAMQIDKKMPMASDRGILEIGKQLGSVFDFSAVGSNMVQKLVAAIDSSGNKEQLAKAVADLYNYAFKGTSKDAAFVGSKFGGIGDMDEKKAAVASFVKGVGSEFMNAELPMRKFMEYLLAIGRYEPEGIKRLMNSAKSAGAAMFEAGMMVKDFDSLINAKNLLKYDPFAEMKRGPVEVQKVYNQLATTLQGIAIQEGKIHPQSTLLQSITDPTTGKKLQEMIVSFGRMGEVTHVTDRNILSMQKNLGTLFAWVGKRFGAFLLMSGAIFVVRDAFRQGVSTMAQYDKQLHEVGRVMKLNVEGSKSLSKYIYDLSQKYNVLRGSIADISVTWVQQGKKMSEVLELTKATSLLMSLSSMQQEEATRLLTAAMSQFGLSAFEATGLIDKLVSVSSKAPVTIEGLAKSLAEAGASAEMMGVDIDHYIGMVTAMSEATGKSGEYVGQSLRMFLSQFQGSGEKGEEALGKVESILQSIGVAVRRTAGEYRDFDLVLADVAAKWKSLSGVQKASIAKGFGSTRRSAPFVGLMENWDRSQEMATESAMSYGVAEKQNEEITKTYLAQLNMLKSTLQELAIALGSDTGAFSLLTNAIKGSNNILKGFIGLMDGMSPAAKGIVLSVGAISVAFLALKGSWKGAIKSWGNLTSAMHGHLPQLNNDISNLQNMMSAVKKQPGVFGAEITQDTLARQLNIVWMKRNEILLSQATATNYVAERTKNLSGVMGGLYKASVTGVGGLKSFANMLSVLPSFIIPVIGAATTLIAIGGIISAAIKQASEFSNKAKKVSEVIDDLSTSYKKMESITTSITMNKALDPSQVKYFDQLASIRDKMSTMGDEKIKSLSFVKDENLREKAQQLDALNNAIIKAGTASKNTTGLVDKFNEEVKDVAKYAPGYVALIKQTQDLNKEYDTLKGNADPTIKSVDRINQALLEMDIKPEDLLGKNPSDIIRETVEEMKKTIQSVDMSELMPKDIADVAAPFMLREARLRELRIMMEEAEAVLKTGKAVTTKQIDDINKKVGELFKGATIDFTDTNKALTTMGNIIKGIKTETRELAEAFGEVTDAMIETAKMQFLLKLKKEAAYKETFVGGQVGGTRAISSSVSSYEEALLAGSESLKGAIERRSNDSGFFNKLKKLNNFVGISLASGFRKTQDEFSQEVSNLIEDGQKTIMTITTKTGQKYGAKDAKREMDAYLLWHQRGLADATKRAIEAKDIDILTKFYEDLPSRINKVVADGYKWLFDEKGVKQLAQTYINVLSQITPFYGEAKDTMAEGIALMAIESRGKKEAADRVQTGLSDIEPLGDYTPKDANKETIKIFDVMKKFASVLDKINDKYDLQLQKLNDMYDIKKAWMELINYEYQNMEIDYEQMTEQAKVYTDQLKELKGGKDKVLGQQAEFKAGATENMAKLVSELKSVAAGNPDRAAEINKAIESMGIDWETGNPYGSGVDIKDLNLTEQYGQLIQKMNEDVKAQAGLYKEATDEIVNMEKKITEVDTALQKVNAEIAKWTFKQALQKIQDIKGVVESFAGIFTKGLEEEFKAPININMLKQDVKAYSELLDQIEGTFIEGGRFNVEQLVSYMTASMDLSIAETDAKMGKVRRDQARLSSLNNIAEISTGVQVNDIKVATMETDEKINGLRSNLVVIESLLGRLGQEDIENKEAILATLTGIREQWTGQIESLEETNKLTAQQLAAQEAQASLQRQINQHEKEHALIISKMDYAQKYADLKAILGINRDLTDAEVSAQEARGKLAQSSNALQRIYANMADDQKEIAYWTGVAAQNIGTQEGIAADAKNKVDELKIAYKMKELEAIEANEALQAEEKTTRVLEHNAKIMKTIVYKYYPDLFEEVKEGMFKGFIMVKEVKKLGIMYREAFMEAWSGASTQIIDEMSDTFNKSLDRALEVTGHGDGPIMGMIKSAFKSMTGELQRKQFAAIASEIGGTDVGAMLFTPEVQAEIFGKTEKQSLTSIDNFSEATAINTAMAKDYLKQIVDNGIYVGGSGGGDQTNNNANLPYARPGDNSTWRRQQGGIQGNGVGSGLPIDYLEDSFGGASPDITALAKSYGLYGDKEKENLLNLSNMDTVANMSNIELQRCIKYALGKSEMNLGGMSEKVIKDLRSKGVSDETLDQFGEKQSKLSKAWGKYGSNIQMLATGAMAAGQGSYRVGYGQIGMALGGLLGPIGSLVGGFVGELIGGKKDKNKDNEVQEPLREVFNAPANFIMPPQAFAGTPLTPAQGSISIQNLSLFGNAEYVDASQIDMDQAAGQLVDAINTYAEGQYNRTSPTSGRW